MAKVSLSVQLPAPAERVWQLIGGFQSLPEWFSGITSSVAEQGGRIRRLRVPDGAVIVERLESFSEKDKRYDYSILEGPAPVTNYRSTLRVTAVEAVGDAEEASVVHWSSEFEVATALEAEINQAFRAIYQAAFDELHVRFAV
jgi:uncharacterized protein YndB with AHSA1/START domain